MNSSIENATTLKRVQDDEIDLLELFRLLWKKKWWIFLSGFIGAALAGVYAFTTKEEWTSKTEILPPDLSDLGSYLTVRKEYGRIVSEPLDVGALSASLYGNFDKLLFSLDEREAFLKSSQLYQELSKGKSEEAKRALLHTLARKNVTVIKTDPKKDYDVIGRRVSFTAEKPSWAQDMLKAYLAMLNQKVLQEELETFYILFNEKIKELSFEYETIKHNQATHRNIQLENLNKAYLTAQKAGIKEYSKTVNFSDNHAAAAAIAAAADTKIPLSDSQLSDGTYLFMLGEKYLKAQIDALTEKQIVYPSRYYDIERQLQALKPLSEKISVADTKVFGYLNSPDYPNNRDGISTVIVVLLAAILSMFLSSILCLLWGAIAVRKARII